MVVATSLTDGFAAQQFEPRPLLMGTNKDEGTLFHSSLFAKPVANETDYRAALAHRFAATDIDAIVTHYPTGTDANATIAAVSGDAFFVCPARRTARAVLAKGAPLFKYSFEQPLDNPLLPDAGVIHSAELPFVFGNDDAPTGMIGTAGAPVATAMQAYWQSFVAQAQPAGDVVWPPYDANDSYLTIATPIAPAAGLKTALCDFWDTVTPLPAVDLPASLA